MSKSHKTQSNDFDKLQKLRKKIRNEKQKEYRRQIRFYGCPQARQVAIEKGYGAGITWNCPVLYPTGEVTLVEKPTVEREIHPFTKIVRSFCFGGDQ